MEGEFHPLYRSHTSRAEVMMNFRSDQGGVNEKLVGKTAAERANIKSEEIVKLQPTGSYQNAEYGLTIGVQSVDRSRVGCKIFARAWKEGEQLGFGPDGSVETERFRVFLTHLFSSMIRTFILFAIQASELLRPKSGFRRNCAKLRCE